MLKDARVRVLLALVLIPAVVLAQETPADCEATPDAPGCRRPRTVYVPQAGAGNLPAPAPRSGSVPSSAPAAPSGSAPLNTVPNRGGIGGAGELGLLVAVVAVALLPVIIYAVDSDAPPEVKDRWATFNAEVRLLGGGAWTPDQVTSPGYLAPSLGARGALGWKAIGADASFRTLPGAGFQWDAHLLVRVPPKAHVQGALALGYRGVDFHGTRVGGFEVALPHEYVFWRNGPLQRFGLELRPALLVGPPSVDLRLDAALVIPIYGPVTARAGGNVYSFGHAVRWGFEAGVVAEF